MLEARDRAIALKSLIQFLLASGPSRTLARLLRQHPAHEQNKDRVVQTFRTFMRIGTSPTLAGAEFEGVRLAVQRFIDAEKVEIPPHFVEAARVAGLRADRNRIHDMLSFINYAELPTIAGTIEQNRDLIEIYEGCWRVFRLSSAGQSGNDIKLNRAFLNIKPIRVLEQENLATPIFSLDQRSELKRGVLRQLRSKNAPDDGMKNINRIFGIFVQTGDFVTLLGEREEVSLGMPQVGMMTWPNAAVGRITGHIKQFSGLSLIPNAEGRPIAAYFLASFIEGSHDLSKDAYDKLRIKELGKVRAYSPEEFEEIEESLAPEIYDALRAQSRDQYILSA